MQGNESARQPSRGHLHKTWSTIVRYKWLVAAATPILAFLIDHSADISKMLLERSGPDVWVGALEPPGSPSHSPPAWRNSNLLTEFMMTSESRAQELYEGRWKEVAYRVMFPSKPQTAIRGEQRIQTLFQGKPKKIGTVQSYFNAKECPSSSDESSLYVLPIFLQNLGLQTAKDYKVIISFTSDSPDKPDPGVRIRGYSSDALRLAYFSGDQSLLKKICGNVKLTTLDATKKEKEDEVYSPLTDEFAEHIYGKYNLTRDMVILRGDLEAQLYQVAVLVLDVPKDVPCFGAIYGVECENCSWLTKTNEYFELLSNDGKQCHSSTKLSGSASQ